MKKIFTMLTLGAMTLALVAFSFATAQAKPASGVALQNTAVPTSSPQATDPADLNGNSGAGINGSNTANASVVIWDQFCVKKIPYTLLALSTDATFELGQPEFVPTPIVDINTEVACEGVGTFRDKQVVVCRGPQLTTVTLNINNGGANGAEQFVVPFKACPIHRGDAPAVEPTTVP